MTTQPALDLRLKEAVAQASTFHRMWESKVRIDGVPFDPEGYSFLEELYDDVHPDVCIRKGAQIGMSACAVLTVIERMAHGWPGGGPYRRGVLYILPTSDSAYDFAGSRFNRLLLDNPAYDGVATDTNRTILKRIREAYLYFRGSQSKEKLLSIPVDMLVIDEINECVQDHLTAAEERLAASTYKHKLRLGHPTLPGVGIDHLYEESDQRVWMVKCRACGESTCLEMEFPASVKRREDGSAYRACRKCSGELVASEGEWTALWPGRDRRGYWISQLMSPHTNLTAVMERYEHIEETGRDLDERSSPEWFWNLVLGQSWADLDRAIEASMVLDLCDGTKPTPPKHMGPSWLGADVGKRWIYPVIGLKRGPERLEVLACPKVETFDELADLGRQYNVRCGVIDAQAETRTVEAFVRKTSWAWGHWYTSERSQHTIAWKDADKQVKTYRTGTIDRSHRALVDGRIRFPRITDHIREEVAPQVANLARIVDEDPKTSALKPRWVCRGPKNDHYAHALALGWVASDRVSVWKGPTVPRMRDVGRRRGSRGWMST